MITKRINNIVLPALIAAVMTAGCGALFSQEVYIEPLFEYPTAPDDVETLTDRSEWLMDNFWNSMDFSRSTAVDQNALNHAFGVYVSAMQFCGRQSVLNSVDALIKSLKGNPTLMIQFAKAAEESLYGPRADMWSDEVYIPFLKAVVSEKGISDIRKKRYSEQLTKLKATAPGRKAPSFRYRTSAGHYRDFKPDAQYTIIEFGDPDCDDCRFAKMKLEMAADIADMLEDKSLQILFIMPDVAPDEEADALDLLKAYPKQWIAGVGYGIDDIYDIRNTPSFYLLDAKGNIIVKNMDVTSTVDALREQIKK